MSSQKVIVIGLDGGTWNVIEPLAKDGELPTIVRLMKNGCYGDLESSIPFVTFPAGDTAPDIIFISSEEYQINSNYVVRQTFDVKAEYINTHALQGIFLAYGPDIKKGVEIQNAKIYDVAPTILHILGMPIPEDMDGKVLKEIFKEDSELAKREIEYQEIDEKGTIKGRIKKLRDVGKI